MKVSRSQNPNLLFQAFERDSGKNKAVSDIVLEANQLIKKAKIVDFNLSNSFISNAYFKQRIVEFSYPIRLNENSKFIIAPSDLKLNCKINLESERIKLYECKK